MIKPFRVGILLTLLATTGSTIPAVAGSCQPTEIGPAKPPEGRVPLDWKSYFTALTRLGNVWLPLFGDGNSVTNPWWHDQGTVHPYGSDGFRETWYVANDDMASTDPLYRLWSEAHLDHMDSPFPEESGYVRAAPFDTHALGFPWTSDLGGMKPMRRYFEPAIHDHRTWLYSAFPTPPGYVAGATWDSASSTPRYGYERFGTKLDHCDILAPGPGEPAAYGVHYLQSPPGELHPIRIDFNRVWGNAVGRIYYDYGAPDEEKQIVAEEIGEMVQVALWRGNTPGELCCEINPTQSGGADNTANYGDSRRWTGSPVLASSSTGDSFVTDVRPLNFFSDLFTASGASPDTDPWSRLLFRGTFKVNTNLGREIDGIQYWDVIKTRFRAKLDAGVAPAVAGVWSMNHTYWLRLEPFLGADPGPVSLELFDLDPAAPPPESVPLELPPGGIWNTQWQGGEPLVTDTALVLKSNDGSFAVGMTRDPDAASPVSYVFNAMCSGVQGHPTTCPAANQVVSLDAFAHRTLSSFEYTSEAAYLVLGTEKDVKTRLRQLYCQLASPTPSGC
jgi:hypothetical protein